MRAIFLRSSGGWDGSVRTFAEAARGLAAAGDSAVFLAPRENRVHERLAGEEVDVRQFDFHGSLLGAAIRLRRIAREKSAEIVFVHGSREHAVAALASFLGGRLAVVRRVPAGNHLRLGVAGRMLSRLAPTAFLFSHEADASRFRLERRGASVVVSDIGVAAASDAAGDGAAPTPPADQSCEILCIYEDRARGRTALPVRTVALLAPRHPDVHLAIAGHGSDAEDVRMHVAALDMLSRVALLGERDDLHQLMRHADVGWAACAGDDAAWAILDFMIRGIPVVAAEDGVAGRYIADGITGLIVRPDDAALAAGAMAALVGNRERAAAMGAAARARAAREFSARAMLEGFDRAATAARARSRSRVRASG